MPIGISEEHTALHDAVHGWAERHCLGAVARALLDAPSESRPPFWDELAAQGWLGLHIDEGLGGSGFGLSELVVVAEELGRAGATGPFLSTVVAAAVLQAAGGDVAAATVPSLVDGSRIGAVAFDGELDAEPAGDGGLVVSGTLRPVLSGHLAQVIVARAGEEWVVLEADDFQSTECASVDLTRRVAEITVVGATIPPVRRLSGPSGPGIRDLAAVVFAAEAVGGSQWCVDTAAGYAADRRQFGRPIGQFQGVKHRCANMTSRTELMRAAAWDAARAVGTDDTGPLTAAAAAALVVESYLETAKDCIQVLGGIGFTWEHDAQVYLRRAMCTRALLGSASSWKRRCAQLALSGSRRRLAVDLPPEAEAHRRELRDFLTEIADLDAQSQRLRIAEAGYIAPSWPTPWGRAASPIEQLVIDEEFRAAKIVKPTITIGNWALPPLIVYGTEAQRERWIPPTMRGEIEWCQLFSEPGAGSDLAGLSTRAEKVDGGWLVNGQKVWTSMAHRVGWGILLARTDPDAPKHHGISFFMLDMKSPGIDIRPLRELVGEAFFNEVFFDDVFVPDDCLVGAANDGWRATRTALANERVFMGGGTTIGSRVRALLDLLRTQDLDHDATALAEAGELVATSYALAVLGFRLTLSKLSGADPSPSEAAVRKLLGVEHDQKIHEVGLGFLGAEGAIADGAAASWSRQFLWARQLTIAGGTSEIQRNIIAERTLGLPRDP